MTNALPPEDLTELLCLDATNEGSVSATLGDFWGDPMEADAIARAALAAARARPEHELVSLQGHVQPGLTLDPLALEIETHATGDVVRHCIVFMQDGPRGGFDACMVAPGTGPSHQDNALPPGLPAPDDLPSTVECARTEGWPELYARGPIEFRRVGTLWREDATGDELAHQCWLLPRAPLADDPALHTAALVFAANFYPHWEFERRLGPKFAHDALRLLDRSLHLHGSARWNDWWLLDARAEIARDGRALSTRRLFDRSGALLATATTHARVAVR